ncbi:uncharacterized protein CIMG_12342 [Coccidioides immitis RS]|uniref:Uncharacterized protein n=1 Tax=Coccidioides immitis (strain RS) TaxID=246410 RepID=A0A0D8JVN5_COCIM|nr:uncharacterized protein CIMG_12342 [Coccidioides immitis RS]KJF61372.1 hypothetical protein CIMG_12342 [Coccidioides immitis RS]
MADFAATARPASDISPIYDGQAQLAEFKTALKGWTRCAGALPALATSICATARERGKYTSQPSIEGQSGKQAWVSCRWEGLCSALLTCSAVGIVNTEHTEPTYCACNFRPESVHAVMFRGSTATTDSPAKNADNGRYPPAGPGFPQLFFGFTVLSQRQDLPERDETGTISSKLTALQVRPSQRKIPVWASLHAIPSHRASPPVCRQPPRGQLLQAPMKWLQHRLRRNSGAKSPSQQTHHLIL